LARQRVGIFGGTFNPIHIGHLRSAEEVREAQSFDRILFVPSGSPPHKARQGIAPATHRVEMVRRAIAGHRRFRVCTVEIDRGGRSYSVDTLRELRAATPTARFAFIIGLDAFREIATWKEYTALFALCDLIVTSRPAVSAPPALRSLVPVAARKDFWYQPGSTTLTHCSGHQIIFQQLTDIDVSASTIRDRLAAGHSIRYLVPRSVEQYITKHHLYAPRSTRVDLDR